MIMESGGMYPNIQPGVLGLEMSLHHPQNPHPAISYHAQTQQSAKQGYQLSAKSRNQNLNLSDEEEPGLTPENSMEEGKKKSTLAWQRMKWTDNMVKLLIMVVYYIGDEVGSEANDGKKKVGGGVLQKKGKWKSVSRAMMERGFYVSPQQCEDKFNDLNKRYKRVNDILGKGTSCRVVENQSLLDTMDHLSPKTKEEVKKLLNSKHLFFKEMCVYHNSCAHGGAAVETHPPQQQQPCSHSTGSASIIRNLDKMENEEEEDDEDDDDDVDDGVDEGRSCRKRMKGSTEEEVMNVLQDGRMGLSEKREWMRMKVMELEEQRVGYQSASLELEKQRLKWLKFSSKKEREMEKEKLLNERLKLENQRMVILIRQKELDLDLVDPSA